MIGCFCFVFLGKSVWTVLSGSCNVHHGAVDVCAFDQ